MSKREGGKGCRFPPLSSTNRDAPPFPSSNHPPLSSSSLKLTPQQLELQRQINRFQVRIGADGERQHQADGRRVRRRVLGQRPRERTVQRLRQSHRHAHQQRDGRQVRRRRDHLFVRPHQRTPLRAERVRPPDAVVDRRNGVIHQVARLASHADRGQRRLHAALQLPVRDRQPAAVAWQKQRRPRRRGLAAVDGSRLFAQPRPQRD